ncbi:hypothetical protein A3F28_00505 [Candidatus Uhrbacteria bacterium RIFCSPHIGHO2_12_FULL_57_11]|uniref:Uncharacterized protein n=3 Tax=Parcubacteria group TaxID=1794811 RepID=A0A1F7UMU0_9BACT|nr:MAG: hypothetical protein A2704_01595 [Candidatus Kaiserbacteria bacterium RIFCSPHIGHO2_01_FULL_54_36b]OGL72434.1 MAG: hypothetical protein A3D72_01130 [Candidatus Uhrbacteria bacterium RIFCSPHIGHO2_02_FULL_57_19]OGL79600.1 MAG: hypothetical protein A3F28_00505 [Candidatus Uhrbacteria bacterium RIFCSPHIGHO2_12_FULL_57_11]
MGETCTFILSEGDSPSGDYDCWEIQGAKERVEDPNRYAKDAMPSDWYWRVTVATGQYLFLRDHYEEGDETVSRAVLIQVPNDSAQFEVFKQKAEAGAGQAVYDKILGYKRGPRFHGGPYNYTNDFAGQWLEAFAIRSWQWKKEGESFPANLAEALRLVAP